MADLTCISSMATRVLLADVIVRYRQACGVEVALESVGGVDAARRLAAGEAFDVAVLAGDAIGSLVDAGTLLRGSESTVALSPVAVAVAAGRAVPQMRTRDELVALLLGAASIGYSTGPSGKALLASLSRWGILDTVQARLLQAPPGRPVAALVADGTVEVGLQQLSEMIHSPGIAVAGILPREVEIVTAFTAALVAGGTRVEQGRAFIGFLCSPAADAARTAQGMRPAHGV